MTNTILKCENLNKSFGKKKILKDVSFTINEGDILGFIGPNGSGKTTTIKLILGLNSIDSGNVTINGFDIKKDFESAIKGVGAIVENPDMYITRVGKFLRKTSLDELPQIINIIKGDMCIVGPRPALWNQYDLIEERDKYGANDIVPGLTGWAQINGRDELPIDVKAKLDGEYVERCSFGFDVKCFFLTFVKVLKRDGVVEGKTEEQIVAKQTNE